VTAAFVSGATLNAGFYRDVIEPGLRSIPHSAALLGWGSDVLGYDDERSTDHGWGPRLMLFVAPGDVSRAVAGIEEVIPQEYLGWPVRFGWEGMPDKHFVEVHVVSDWVVTQLGVDALRPLTSVDWLLVPQQQLLGVVAGAVYADPRGELTRLRETLAWYPDQLWRWLLACQWTKISQEEAFVGRSAEAGDDVGSAVLAGRIVRELMRLAFLQQRRYAPYGKWLGTAFSRLAGAGGLVPVLQSALSAPSYAEREQSLVTAYELLARAQNALALHEPVDPTARNYHTRPFRVLHGGRFAEALAATVDDPALTALPQVGSVDQWIDSTDLLSEPGRMRAIRSFYASLSNHT
jgi:Domain of unknown function (DUF4037)